ncbi:Ubiquitin-like-specific protease 1A [Platanthera guangdongensis]|uniref:Ubiquitin-like-specific protease 1A n=1 Tax=Platanthera guangdongensis TaxID=2320717 RepID=A0ABR2MR62_9ASPA
MACIFPLLMMPGIPQNIPLLYVLLRLYNRDKQAFLIGNYYMKLTVNEVALILGLPNSGVSFKFTRSPLLDLTHKCLNEKLSEVTEEEWSPTLEERRISLVVKYLLCMFFFPLKNLKAIHGFLHSQFDGLSKICEVRGAGENIGYLEGCSTVLLVITTFANVGDDELSLLGVEELESDFETGPEKKEKRKRDVKVDSLGYESEKEKKMKYKKQEKDLLKKIKSEIKKERKGNVKSDEGWRGMETRLKSYIKSEVEGLKTFCESLFLKFQAGLNPTPTPSPPPHSPPSPHSPIMTSVSPTPLSQPASTLECTLVSPTQIRSHELVSRTPRKSFPRAKTVSRRTFQKGQIIEYELDYPGRLHVADKIRKTLDSLKALQEDALHAFPEGFIDWPVEDARKSPQQSNSYDCGVFVIKYMEVVTSLEVVTWQDHQGWQADMPRFRAEIAAQICKTFARHIADKMVAC